MVSEDKLASYAIARLKREPVTDRLWQVYFRQAGQLRDCATETHPPAAGSIHAVHDKLASYAIARLKRSSAV